jgi:protein required for attachment to host cells
MKTWVVVASAARARIFEADSRREPLREVQDLVNPEDRLQSRALKTDKPGRAFDHLGGQRHSMGTAVNPKEQVAIRFAKQVADQLDSDRLHRRFGTLCVAAPPRFLGLLRGQMGHGLARTVTGEVIHDLTQQDVQSVQRHMAHLL